MKAIISDFGGVLTTPLVDAFKAVENDSGIKFEELVAAMRSIKERDGAHPMFELECGRITEDQFTEGLSLELQDMGTPSADMTKFSEVFFSALEPNHAMIELMREFGGSDRRMALLTNNVREWGPRWRSMAPIDDLFEIIVDSAYVGCRKPEPQIYHLTLDRLELEPSDCLFVDDVEINCDAAAALGIKTVHFRDTAQAINEIRDVV